jgi:RimJ/RimL family protein N-acetyltransferase
MKVEPVILEGAKVRLVPLEEKHFDDLAQIAFEESLWKWTLTQINDENDLHEYIREALDGQAKGEYLPFVTILQETGKIIGATRFGEIDINNRAAEIGWTWIHPDFQRSFVNTEAKYLMLKHAFETWKCIRVFLLTDFFNEKSRSAIARLGAKQEGIIRNHFILPTGRIRSSVMFSIIDAEWAEVKADLERKLAR